VAKRKIPGQKGIEKKRGIDWNKYPRALDMKHGMKMDETLFPGLTPSGFKPAEPPKEEDAS
jgi:hypothetical protein